MQKNNKNICSHYDEQDAHRFYLKMWAGKDVNIGIGLYEKEEASIFEACQATVAKMLDMLSPLNSETKLLELGAGYGASARYIAEKKGCYVDCINMSGLQNSYNMKMNQERGLTEKVKVIQGSFEELNLKDAGYDVAWSQDAFLHSDKKEKILKEVWRILKPGGSFIFSDILQKEDCSKELIAPVLKRFDLPVMGSFRYYKKAAKQAGFKTVSVTDLSDHIVTHYKRLIIKTEKNYKELSTEFDDNYLNKLKNGMKDWIKSGQDGILKWGIFFFKKPQNI